ncbi:MAG: FAD-binding oxidoreductase [Deltaproteobacteria bacterium]|nr:MAG: FAD-binding oxidoreductase [Deltaproteobacteria bacterium]
MTPLTKTFKDYPSLREHLKSHVKTLYFSSQTSTVIPYDFLEGEMVLGNLSALPGEIKLLEDGILEISGGMTWKEARAFARSKGLDIMALPTEESASVLAGIATSCTGERSFGFGTLRDQVDRITYLDFEGEERVLNSDKSLEESELLIAYQSDFAPYVKMKNGPFPRLKNETDLMIGMEGQLGVVKEIHLKSVLYEQLQYILIPVGKWEESFETHLDIFNKVQNFRGIILSCELIDHNSLEYLGSDKVPVNRDIIVIEIRANSFEKVYEGFLVNLGINLDEIIELSEGDYHYLRMEVPRKIQEENSRKGIIKKGTDAQVSVENFGKLLDIYREMGKKGIPYILFGHFGDGHLHFNFLPDKGEVDTCEKYLKEFYKEVKALKGSPFAEHGVGLIKQEFIRDFLGETQLDMFKHLKNKFDPYNQFFPQGFLNL